MARRRKALPSTVTALLIAAALGAWTAGPARGAEAPEMRRIFEQLLQNPSSPELNFRYAQLAVQEGELRKALAAYERVLAADPNNEEAKREIEHIRHLLSPEYTTATLILGYQYETNPAHVPNAGSEDTDHTFVGRGQVRDERNIGATRWRTESDLFANYHADFHSLDYGNLGAQTGPVFDLSENLKLYTALGVAYSWLDGRTFFVEGSGSINLETREGPFKGINFRGAYEEIGDSFSTLEAYSIEVNPRWLYSDLATDSDIVILNPVYRFHGVVGSGQPGVGPEGTPFPLRGHTVGGRADYYYPLKSDIYLGVNMTVEYTRYSRNVAGKSNNRQDVYLSPGAQLVLIEPILKNSDVIFSYQYENNDSNDNLQAYSNHIVGVQTIWRF